MTSLKENFDYTLERVTAMASLTKPFERLKTLKTDQSGNVGMLFGGTLLVMTAAVGGAVDYGRWLNARSQTQNALDAASLAGGRVLQLGGTADKAVAAAKATYDAQKSNHTSSDTINFAPPTNGNTAIAPIGTVVVATPFLSIIGIEEMPVIADASTVSGSCVGPACGTGGNTGTSIEISMMLDTTGSMCNISGGQYQQPCSSSTKLDALKSAAKDLVDIVVWDDQSKYTSKIAIAPFANGVNVGKYFHAVTNEGVAGDNPTRMVVSGYTSYSYPSGCYKNGNLKSSCANKPEYGVGPIYSPAAVSPCVVERIGVNEFSDVSPAGTKLAPVAGQALTTAIANATNNSMIPWNQSTSTCGESSSIQPLTKDKVALKSTIDGLIGKNGTAGALGTAWAWYLVSPEWSNIFTGSAAPLPYSQLTELGESGKPKLRKIVVLMTDGAYNTHQQDPQGVSDLDVQTKAKALCTAMKNKGIMVYTIGFDLGGDTNAINTLTDCASSHSIDSGATVKNFYNAETPTALQAAFRDIALQVSKLRLTR